MLSVDDLREEADNRVQEEFKNAQGIYDPLRPKDQEMQKLPLFINAQNQAQLPEYLKHLDGKQFELPNIIIPWLEKGGCPIAQLSAPVGQGKTIATCILQQELHYKYLNKVAIWIRMGGISCSLETERNRIIPSLLGMSGYCNLSDIKCVILDGIDEYLNQGSGNKNLEKLRQILVTLCRARVPIVISGRDIALGNSFLYKRFQRMLKSIQSRYAHSSLEQSMTFELLPWKDEQMRKHLKDRLHGAISENDWTYYWPESQSVKFRIGVTNELLNNINYGLLTSPLLFGLAYDLLATQLRNPSTEICEISTRFDLIRTWIGSCMERDDLNRASDNNPSNVEDRRIVTQRLALYLVCCGKGSVGVEKNTLDHEDFEWIWGSLKACPAPSSSIAEGLKHQNFKDRVEEMLNCCLLQLYPANGYIAHFHSQILVHLAAEAIDELMKVPDKIDFPTPAPPHTDIWVEIRKRLPQPLFSGLDIFGEIVTRYIDSPTLNSNSDFGEALSYWMEYKIQDQPIPDIDLQQLYQSQPTSGTNNTSDLFDRRVIGAAGYFLDTLRKHKYKLRSEQNQQPVSVIRNQHMVSYYTKQSKLEINTNMAEIRNLQVMSNHISSFKHSVIDFVDSNFGDSLIEREYSKSLANHERKSWLDFQLIPSGKYLIWDMDENGNALPILTEIITPTLLTKQLVTVEQYAQFLDAEPSVHLPNQPEADWRRNDNGLSYNPSMAGEAVRGVSRTEANKYCAWLSKILTKIVHLNRVQLTTIDIHNFQFQLPESIHLRVAAAGKDLRRPYWHEPSMFGFRDLLCHTWQHTNDYKAFGGSKELGGQLSSNIDPKEESAHRDRAQQVYEAGYLTGTREINSKSHDTSSGFRICLPVTLDESTSTQLNNSDLFPSMQVKFYVAPKNQINEKELREVVALPPMDIELNLQDSHDSPVREAKTNAYRNSDFELIISTTLSFRLDAIIHSLSTKLSTLLSSENNVVSSLYQQNKTTDTESDIETISLWNRRLYSILNNVVGNAITDPQKYQNGQIEAGNAPPPDDPDFSPDEYDLGYIILLLATQLAVLIPPTDQLLKVLLKEYKTVVFSSNTEPVEVWIKILNSMIRTEDGQC